MSKQGNSGAAGGHQQSIAGETDAPVDGILGSHAGGIEPAGDDVDAGWDGDIRVRRQEGNVQQSSQGNKQTGSIAQGEQPKGTELPGNETGTVGSQGPGGAQQGGNVNRQG